MLVSVLKLYCLPQCTAICWTWQLAVVVVVVLYYSYQLSHQVLESCGNATKNEEIRKHGGQHKHIHMMWVPSLLVASYRY
jgi:hypothetical protein